MVEPGIVIGLPEGTYGRLAARSGMASKMGIAVGGGPLSMRITLEKLKSYFEMMVKRTACLEQEIG